MCYHSIRRENKFKHLLGPGVTTERYNDDRYPGSLVVKSVRDCIKQYHENSYTCAPTLCLHSLQMMQSNIDGMMANYDQISAEREELLESLADV